MQITLNQEEIEAAIETYVRSQISIADNQKVTIDLKSTRGESGMTAVLEVRAVAAQPAKKATRSATTKSEKTEKPDPKPVQDTSETSAPEKEPDAVESLPTKDVDSGISDEDNTTAVSAEPSEPRKGSIFQFGGKEEAAG